MSVNLDCKYPFVIQVFEAIDVKSGATYIAKRAASEDAYERELSNLQLFKGMYVSHREYGCDYQIQVYLFVINSIGSYDTVVKLVNFWAPVLVLEIGTPLLSIEHPNSLNAVRVIAECTANALSRMHSLV